VILKLIQRAARVISKSSRDQPADAVLRAELKAVPSLARRDAGAVSRAVFAYFRWRRWLAEKDPLERQIEQAIFLATRFRESPGSFSDAELTAKSVPEWVSEQIEISPAWARLLQADPKIWLRARPGREGELVGSLSQAQAGPISCAVLYEGREDLFRMPEFHAGEFELQDIASQAIGHLCAAQPGQRWWDVCAGEGGKMLHLADLMQNKGLIWASDRAQWRLKRLRLRAARAKVFNFRTAVWDGGPKRPTKTEFNGVLLDAPCSGIGTWQRNPHARWTTTLADVHELAQLQLRLLAHAASSVKRGGRLVYSVCTLTRAETRDVAEAFEKQFPEFEPCPVPDPFAPTSPAQSRHWLWPQGTGGGGMFASIWLRKSDAGSQGV
jgi:16S rRNA (cytosine967-C5)-methyltransferase